MTQNTKDAVQSPTNSLFPSAERPFFYTDPSGDGSCFFSNEAERDAAMAEAIAAWCDEGWSEEVEQIFAGVVSHTVKQCDVQKKPQPCAVHPDHDYGDNDCEACIAWDEFPNHEFDEVCNYKPVALRAPTAEQAEGVRVLTADDADMVWPDDDGESMFHTIDDAVNYVAEMNWPDTTPLEVQFQIAKRIPTAKVRIFNITENGHEWEIVAAPASSAGDREVERG